MKQFKAGQEIAFVKDNLPPNKSINTKLISQWLGHGGKLLEQCGYEDVVEQVDGEVKRTVTWCIDNDVKANFGHETINFAEFRKRFFSDEWKAENPFHPITHAFKAIAANAELRQFVNSRKPSTKISKGRRYVVIPHDATPERKAQLEAML